MKAAGKAEVETRVAWARMTNVLRIRDIDKYELYKRDCMCEGIVNRNRIRAGPVLNMNSFSRRREHSLCRVDNSSTKSVRDAHQPWQLLGNQQGMHTICHSGWSMTSRRRTPSLLVAPII
jgi:hypothetical protein